MHPALSVIFFTTSSGAGYGLLFLLGVFGALGILPPVPVFGFVAFGLAFAAITAGLLSSTFHLGHPERAWRALSQWRSSWLSREGVAAIATYAPAGLFAAGWVLLGRTDGLWSGLGLLAAAGAVVTVWCTAMIYRSLRPIRRWCNAWVVPNYLALAVMTGALLLAVLTTGFGIGGQPPLWLVLGSIAIAFVLKLGYWHFIDTTVEASTPETATGLGGIGKVRSLEAPHTSENYLLKEMGYQIARKHAGKLRRIAALLAFILPFALSLLAALLPGLAALPVLMLAAISALAGVAVERWLFFAEAKHAVTLYYGRAA
jgi:DMSO reductase anchor subunit